MPRSPLPLMCPPGPSLVTTEAARRTVVSGQTIGDGRRRCQCRSGRKIAAPFPLARAAAGPGPARVYRGETEGRIAEGPDGMAGFGYDPLFFHAELGHTFGRATADEKHERSHRGTAFRALARDLSAGPVG